MALKDLRESPMMSHLLDALDRGEDIGRYGRLTFAIVARHFLPQDEVIHELMKDSDCDEQKARGLVRQVEARGYNPPKRERLVEWMNQQDFPICENTNDGEGCNVYKSLNFPREVYEKIAAYYEQEQPVT